MPGEPRTSWRIRATDAVMAKINWTGEAEDWLKKIHGYIAQDNMDAATRVVQSIYQRVEVLNDFPLIG